MLLNTCRRLTLECRREVKLVNLTAAGWWRQDSWGGIRQWSQGWSDRDQDITERDEVCHGRMQAPLTGGHAPLVHCSTRWFPGVDQGVDQGWIRVDQGGSRVDQVFASRRGRQKRMGNVGAPHSCVARGGGRTCPFVIIKRRKRGARSARGPHGAGGLPSGAPRRETGAAVRQLWKRARNDVTF